MPAKRAWRVALIAVLAACSTRGYVVGDSRWPDGSVTFDLHLGAPGAVLFDGSANWDAVAQSAIDLWNRRLGRLQLVGIAGSTAAVAQGNRRNNLFFADDAFGRDFGDRTIAITFSSRVGTRRVEADIVFKRGENWNSYRGNTRFSGGNSVLDLRRVALHELGHAIGLGHPDDEGQSVAAIMNSRVGNLDTLADDDVAGGQSLYGVRAEVARVANLSIRSGAGTGDDTLIVGFVVAAGSRQLLIRGIGPTLTQYGVSGVLPDPRLVLYRSGTPAEELAANDNWGGGAALVSAFTAAGAFALPGGSADAALQTTLPPGAYSVHLNDPQGRSGIGLVETYATDPNSVGQLVNLSARTRVGTGDNVLIAGFVVTGAGEVRLLIRGIGPTLAGFGVGGVLNDPQLQVYRGSVLVASNNDWGTAGATASTAGSAVGAFALPVGSRDAALVIELEPGNYSAQVAGVGGTTGVALVELYVVP